MKYTTEDYSDLLEGRLPCSDLEFELADKLIEANKRLQEQGQTYPLGAVSQQRELLIGYSKLTLGENYEAFEEFELKKIDEYLANL